MPHPWVWERGTWAGGRMGAAAPRAAHLHQLYGMGAGSEGLGEGCGAGVAARAAQTFCHGAWEHDPGCPGGGQEGPAVTSGSAAAAGVGSQGPEASAGPTAPGLGAGLGDAEQGRGDAVGAGRQQEGGCSPWPPFGHRHQVGSCTLPSSSRSCSATGLVLSPAATGSPLPTFPGGCGGPDSGTGAAGAGGLPSPQAGVPAAVALAAAGPLTEAVAQNLVIKGRGQVIGFCKSNQVH